MNLKSSPLFSISITPPLVSSLVEKDFAASSAAIISNVLMQGVDFANIGSNDLLQYTIASDRTHPLEQKKYHILHPSLIYLFDLVIKNASRALTAPEMTAVSYPKSNPPRVATNVMAATNTLLPPGTDWDD